MNECGERERDGQGGKTAGEDSGGRQGLDPHNCAATLEAKLRALSV